MATVSSRSPSVYSEIADRLAWLHDGGELDDYPGPGWDGQDRTVLPAEDEADPDDDREGGDE